MSDSTSSTGEKRSHDSSVNNGSGSMDVECKREWNGIPRSEFVVVSDNSGDAMELPTSEDNTLFMTTLQSSYPGATGMKYKNPKTGALRAVAVDATGTKLLPPLDGWDDKVFTVITSNARVDREPASSRRPVDLIVLGVNYKTTDEGFKKYFESFGTVSFAEIKRTSEGSSKGFGFVQMSTLEEQDKVLATACHMLDGRRCEIRIPDQKVCTSHSFRPPPGVYARPPYDAWVSPPPSGHHGTPRSSRGPGGPHEQPWNRHAKEVPPTAYPGPGPQPGRSGIQPRPAVYPRNPRDGLAGQAASNQIASGLDALNLNQKNPELLSAAWNAFFNTLSHGGASPQPHKQW
ncbi:hypothetical protein OSTOST_12012 [Ostertagia ostertagi]